MVNKIESHIIVNSLAWKFLERILSQGINLIVQILLARILLPSDFGSLAIIVAITNYAALFVQSGLATTIVQKMNLEEGDVNTLLSSSLGISFVFFITLYLLAPWLAKIFVIPQLIWPLRIQSSILFLNAINSVQTALLARNMKFSSLFWRSAIAVPISGTIGIIMANMGFGIWALVTQNLVNMLVVVIIMFIGTEYKFRLDFSLKRAKSMYSFSGKILLTSLVSGFGDTVRTIIVGKKFDTNNLAYYDKAYTYSNYVTQMVNATIQSVMLPAFSRQQDDLAVLKDLVRKSVRFTAFIMFPVLFGVIASSRPLIILLLTSKWESCIPFLMIFCVLRLPGCITTLDKQVFYSIGKSGIGLCFEIGLLVANLSMLIISVPIGIGAIAIGATIVEYIGCIITFYLAKKIYKYSFLERLEDLIKPLINSLVMAFIIWMVSLLNLSNFTMLVSQVFIGIVTYGLMTKVTNDNNINYIKNFVANKKKSN